MNEEEMLQRLEEHHRTIGTGLDRIRGYCEGSRPFGLDLERDRSALTEASLARSRFVNEEVIPALLVGADDDLRNELSELLHLNTAKRQLSNAHIRDWNPATITTDWKGYCAASRTIRAMMEAQIERERRVLVMRLKERSNVAVMRR
jgi:hypothetical protein